MLILIYIYNVPPFGDCCQQVGKNIIRFISVSNLKIIWMKMNKESDEFVLLLLQGVMRLTTSAQILYCSIF